MCAWSRKSYMPCSFHGALEMNGVGKRIPSSRLPVGGHGFVLLYACIQALLGSGSVEDSNQWLLYM